MAQNEIVNVLTIKTEDSQKTIKGLKKEIADLKKVLDNAVIGTDEFEQASRDLKVAQNELKTAMTGQKQTVEALDGSYDALVQEMAKLKKEWRATADVVKRNEIGEQIDIINSQLKELDATIGNNQRLVGSYAEEFKKALGEQDDATIRTRTQLESVQKVTAGLASGYAAVQGAMTLLNIENENLQKAMVKVQSAMAIAQGVGGMKDLVEGASRAKVAFAGVTNGVKTFIGGLSGVQKAIIGTGIGALVVAVGLLIANWDKVTEVLNKYLNVESSADASARRLTESYRNLNSEIKNTNSEREREIEILKAEGKSNKEILEIQLKDAQDQLERFDKKRGEYYKQIQTWDYNKENIIFYDLPENYDQVKQDYEAIISTIEEQNEKIKNIKNKIRIEEIIANKKSVEDNKKIEEEKQKNRIEIEEELRVAGMGNEDKELYNLKKKYDSWTVLFKDNKQKLNEIDEWYKNQRLLIAKKYIDEEIAEEQKLTNELKAEQDKRDANSRTNLARKFDKINKGAADKLYTVERQKPTKFSDSWDGGATLEMSKIDQIKAITEETLKLKLNAIDAELAAENLSFNRKAELAAERVTLQETTNRQLSELNEQYKAQEEARNKAIATNTVSTFTTALSSASQIISALQDGIDTDTKEGFERNKKMQIANATIQMLTGIVNAISTSMALPQPWGAIQAGINAATVATVGGIQIANIKKQTFDGGSSSAVAVPTMGMSDNLPVSYTRNLMGDNEAEEMNAAQKVYILESEIEEAGRKAEVRDNNTNF